MHSYSDPVLPDDVWDLILDHFDDSSPHDRSALFACSYVNRNLSILSQKRIFKDVRLNYDSVDGTDPQDTTILVESNQTTTGRKFLQLLEGSPHIASYVHSLTVQTNSQRDQAWKSRLFEPTCCLPGFSLYQIASQLDQLTGFTLQGSLKWERIEQRTQSFLLNVVRRMQRLRLASVEQLPISAFQGCRDLQELCISSLNWDIPDDIIHVKKVKLSNLDIGNPSTQVDFGVEIFDSPHSPFDFTQLRTLRLSTLRYTVAGINRMLSVCAESLEVFEFSVNKPFADPSLSIALDPPSLSSARNLRHLTLSACVRERVSYNAGETYCSTDFAFIDSMIQTLPSFHSRPSSGLQIDLSITLQQLNPRVGSIPWSKLFRSMNEARISSSLKVINLMVWKIYGYIRLASLSEIPGNCPELKELHERGLVNYGNRGIEEPFETLFT
ncbi:hypothetical protein CPB84DRAFT_1856860 [Gymnopilus junonius]|uniref:F-box domain-containing protein n=1 Tax=Gymnopilus junonius TaxID=109634 RepID=A0A9P5N792_GYMJU|nr:hypothetical protein CPB84DRAFT_1856860 [Gymnopilus junonius]